MSKRINLTKIDGCYSKELRESCNSIKILLKDRNTTVETMKQYVYNVIEPASINADAKKRFQSNLSKCSTKEEIDDLCHHAVIHGMYYMPRKNSK